METRPTGQGLIEGAGWRFRLVSVISNAAEEAPPVKRGRAWVSQQP